MTTASDSGGDATVSRRAAALFVVIGLGIAIAAVAGTMWLTGGEIGRVVVRDAAVDAQR
jgi:hypothetical protein